PRLHTARRREQHTESCASLGQRRGSQNAALPSVPISVDDVDGCGDLERVALQEILHPNGSGRKSENRSTFAAGHYEYKLNLAAGHRALVRRFDRNRAMTNDWLPVKMNFICDFRT